MGLFKIPVNVPPDVAQFRAEYSAYARWLPPHLANVLIGAICTADAHGEDAVTTYEAISAATHTPGLQKRYKCMPVSPRQVERCMPMLQELGVLTWHSEKTRVTGWSDHYGEIRTRIYLRLTIANIERLYELAEKARHEKAVRDADRAARRAGYEQARNESRKAERARNTIVTCEDDEAINSCPTPNGGSSGGTDGGSSGGRIVPNRSFVTDRKANHHQEPGDDGHDHSFNQSQDQNQGPSAPRPAGADEVPGDKPFEFTSEGKENWAGHLGVPLSSIRESFWIWFGHRTSEMYDKAYDGCQHGCYNVSPCQCTHSDECDRTDEGCTCPCPVTGTSDCGCPCPASGSADKCECRCEHDGYFETGIRAATKVAKGASVKENPVGYFQTILMQHVDLALHRAKHASEAKAAEAARQRQAEEDAADRQRQAEEAENTRQRKQEQAREAARQRAQNELDEILPELAELRFGGDIDAARDDIEIWGDPRNQLEKAQMYLARSRAGLRRAS